jgi:hypothetical protein
MLQEKCYHSIVDCLKELKLNVHEEAGFTDFINYKHNDDKYTIYGIDYSNDLYTVSTLFGMMEYKSLEEVLFILRQDWNQDNWITIEEKGESYITLKDGLD